ncbi:glycoside hydrolase family 68 protein [Clostridium sp. DJ247]|uniref:glycoside hydrolase family 68 protein n=1 Tax=Clostridium sp. DJ247 TaxID=2726188 RepID=UPI0016270C77|nr:glycoside hydrolase family 68 protein [Clostridium sp. DJ247]MBC2582620.1 hypothetical protein [Clostridium sp. DJ247]
MASHWTRDQTRNIKITLDNEAPEIQFPVHRTAEDLWIWDTWPLLNEDGSVSVANTPGTAEQRECEPVEARAFSVAVGLAVATKPDLTEWRFLPHILDADCVNQELSVLTLFSKIIYIIYLLILTYQNLHQG